MKKEIMPTLMIFCVLLLAIFFSGCLGQHNTCPECNGSGECQECGGTGLALDWDLKCDTCHGTGECQKCGGDGKVGQFMDDEGIEDILSFIVVIVLIVFIVAGIAGAAKSQKPPVTQQPPPVVIQQRPPQPLPEQKRNCVSCGRAIPFDAQICPYCSHDYRQPQIPQPPPPVQPPAPQVTQLQYCPSCGRKLEPQWSVCVYCGRKLK